MTPRQQPQPSPQRQFLSPNEYWAQKQQAMRNEKKALSKSATKAALLLILYNIMNLVSARIFYIIVYSVVSKSPTISLQVAVEKLKSDYADLIAGTAFRMSAMLFTVLLSTLVVFITGQFLLKADLVSWFRPSKKNVAEGFKWAPSCITVNLIVSVFAALIVDMLSSGGVNVPKADFTIKTPTTLGLTMQFLYVCVAGPFAEEFIYRGVILRLLSPYGKGLAVFVSALFFGVMHGNLSQTVPTFIGGMLFAAVAVSCDSLIPTLIIHICNNVIASINDFGTAMNKDFSNIYLGAAILMMIIGFYVMLVFINDLSESISKNQQYALSAGKRTSTVFVNVAMIIYIGIFLVYPYIESFIQAN